MKVKTGDIVVYHDTRVQVIDASTNNGIGIRYLEGPKINWEDPRAAATAFMTITMMLCTYSITNGIMIGAMTYVLFTLLTRKFEKKDIVVTVIAVLGLLKFILVAM